ncbi:MAG: hypothetical protein M1510_06995 [Nitrospirae bacterium]|nr:hypothetical protein [Nitrospirota bacterium]
MPEGITESGTGQASQKRKKLTPGEIQELKLRKAAEYGTYVVKGLSLESRALIRNINEYDSNVLYIKRSIGRPNIDQNGALALLEKCIRYESDFAALVKELSAFIQESKNSHKGNQATLP